MDKIRKSGFIKEFKEFISRGSVVDLAVGVVIGTAFSAIINSVVNDIIMPVVGLIIGGVNFTDLKITIPNFFGGDTSAVIAYGNFIQNVVNFLVIALALFIVIKVINKMNEKAKAAAARLVKAEEKEEEKAAEKKEKQEDETVKLLREIRDSLKKKTK